MVNRIRAMEGQTQPVHLAIVVPRPAVFGFPRVWEAEVGDIMKETIRLFWSTEDAIAWLRDIECGVAVGK